MRACACACVCVCVCVCVRVHVHAQTVLNPVCNDSQWQLARQDAASQIKLPFDLALVKALEAPRQGARSLGQPSFRLCLQLTIASAAMAILVAISNPLTCSFGHLGGH